MADQQCVYISCREPASYEVQFDGRKHWLCDRHIRPEYHPPDLHKKLPGAVKRTVQRIRSGSEGSGRQ